MVAYLTEVAESKRSELDGIEAELRRLLIPKDPNDEKDVIVEIRSAAGGEEAALWAGDLYRMYERFAERSRWSIEPIDVSPSDTGGLKEATFAVKGKRAYSRFKFEAGPHRVQRVPKTESQGRVEDHPARSGDDARRRGDSRCWNRRGPLVRCPAGEVGRSDTRGSTGLRLVPG
jgi:peptide chain release factor 1